MANKLDAKHAGPSAWEKLQPRERMLVLALIGVFFVMTTMVMIFLRHQKLKAIDEEVADLRMGLDLVRTQGASYQEKLAVKARSESKISTESLLFASLVESAEAVAEVKANSQNEKEPVEVVPGLRRRTYEFDLRSVTLAQLTKFLSTIESNESHVVLTQELTIRSPSTSEDRLNVNVVLATYERVAIDGEAEEEEN